MAREKGPAGTFTAGLKMRQRLASHHFVGETLVMKANLDHLPERQQQELAAITGYLLRGFETAVARSARPWHGGAKIYKIILFGSYARGSFVNEPKKGYQSDFDILVVVSHKELTAIADYWLQSEEKILKDPAIGRFVNLIVHDLVEVDTALKRDQRFFGDIVREGVALYEPPGHAFPVVPR